LVRLVARMMGVLIARLSIVPSLGFACARREAAHRRVHLRTREYTSW